LTAKRDKAAAMRFFDKAMQANGIPEKVTMDKSGAVTVKLVVAKNDFI
jgi:transposase-like protein